MRLHQTPEVLGRGFHRAGWPSLLKCLSKAADNTGILFVDSAEIHLRAKQCKPITEPWVGIWHLPPLRNIHPAVMKECVNKNELFEEYSHRTNAQVSLSNLQAFITLSDYATGFQHQSLPYHASGHTLRYPHEPVVQHSRNRPKYLLHNGTFLKNSAILHHFVKPYDSQTKLVIFTEGSTSPKHYQFFKKFFDQRCVYEDVEFSDRVTDMEYDSILRDSMVVMEYMDCSASTTIVECMACNVPIVVNRHPAVVEYLGTDYPLLYDSYEEIPYLITQWRNAVEYLRSMDKTELQASHFIDSLTDILKQYE